MGTAKIYIGSYDVAGGYALGEEHSYLLYDPDTDNDNDPTTGVGAEIIRGGQENSSTPVSNPGRIALELRSENASTDTFDEDRNGDSNPDSPADRNFRELASGTDAASKWGSMSTYVQNSGTYDAIKDQYLMAQPYSALGTNSNSVANTILSIVGLDFRDHTPLADGNPSEYQHSQVYPGFNHYLDGEGDETLHIYAYGDRASNIMDAGGDDTFVIEEGASFTITNDGSATGSNTIIIEGVDPDNVLLMRFGSDLYFYNNDTGRFLGSALNHFGAGGEGVAELVVDYQSQQTQKSLIGLDYDDLSFLYDHNIAAQIELLHVQFDQGEENRPDPLVIDLNGNGQIDLADPNTVYFDVDGDAFAQSVSWLEATDGFLVRDANENGAIDGITEMFGGAGVDGFTALAAFDYNSDGTINATDDIWSDLQVWQDLNQDGYAQSGELSTLTSLNITGIDLAATPTASNPLITHDGTATTTTGTIRVSNMLFDADNVNTRYSGDYTLDLATLFLPTLRGYGQVADLHIAASIDTSVDSNGDTILDKLTALAGHTIVDLAENFETITADIDTLLYHWAGVEDVGPYSRGAHVEEVRPLAFLEKYLNEQFNDGFLGGQSIGVQQMMFVNDAFNQARDKFLGALIFQAAGKELFDSSVHYDIAKDSVTGSGGIVLSEDRLDDLSDYAAGLATTNERSDFWQQVANLLWYVNKAVDPAITSLNQFGLNSTQEALLDDAIHDSDATLTWYQEDQGVGGLFSIEYSYTNISGLYVSGTGGDDTLNGSALDDSITGFQGNDTIDGSGGNDQIYGREGGDVIHGGSGNDHIEGDNTGLIIVGGDTLYGDDGNDYINGGRGQDNIYGGAGDDQIWGDIDPNVTSFFGNEGADDYLDGGAGSDFIDGYEGNDIIVDGYGATGQNLLSGGKGDDIYRLIGEGSEVYIQMGDAAAGNDTIELPAVFVDETELAFERIANHLHITGSKSGYSVDIYIIEQYGGAPWLHDLKFQAGLPGEYVFDLLDAKDASGFTTYGTPGDDVILSSDTTTGNSYADTIYGGAGNDIIRSDNGNDTLYGEDGDDLIKGETGNDTLHGGGGNDDLQGGDGNDTLYGDDGNDRLEAGFGTDTLYGGDGNDTLIASNNSDYSTVDGGDGDDTYTGRVNTTIVASDGHDILTTNAGGIIQFQAGVTAGQLTYARSNINDLTIFHPDGDITLKNYFTGSAATLRFSDTSTLALTAVTAQLAFYGTSGNDTMNGVDSYWGNPNDLIYGYDGNDTINAFSGNNTVYGGNGNDTISAGNGNDYLDGGAGDDQMYGGNGTNTFAVDGDDYINPGSGYDTILMPTGITASDIVMVREVVPVYGWNVIKIQIASSGSDILVEQFSTGNSNRVEKILFSDASYIDTMTTRQYETRGTSSGETINGIEAGGSVNDIIYAYGGNDTVNAGTGNNVVYGGDGDDTIKASSGNDYLDGGSGNDALYGYDGADTYVFNGGVDAIFEADYQSDKVVFSAGYDVADFTFSTIGNHAYFLKNGSEGVVLRDYVFGSYYRPETFEFASGLKLNLYEPSYWDFGTTSGDSITTGNTARIIIAKAGDDTVHANAQADQIDGGTGNDTLYGGAGNDYIFDASGTDALYGEDGADTLYGGGTGNDILDGGNGNDSLYGGSANDQLHGQNGLDNMWGGAGADTFYFAAANAFNNVDVINDFSTSDNDAIDISDLLGAYDPLTEAIEDFVRVTDNGTDSFLAIDADGGANSFVQIATLKGIIGLTDEALLEANGNLII